MSQLKLFDSTLPVPASAGSLRTQGIQQSLSNADKAVIDWSVKALTLMNRFPASRFMVEDLRAWAYQQGLPKPPSERAWGGVIAKAKNKGMILHSGYQSVKNPKAHCTPASCWIRVG